MLNTNPDTHAYLIQFLTPKELVNFGMCSTYTCSSVRSSPMNMELSRLKLHKFGSHDIIHRYYIYDMIHLITQHSYDHHQAVILAATHGYLDLLEFIHKEATIINFPLASYSIRDPDIITQAFNRASVYGHYHIMKWFADVSIVDNWLMPGKFMIKSWIIVILII